MRIHWRAGSRIWINQKATDGSEVPTGIALQDGNNEEIELVGVKADDGWEHQVSKRSVWMVKYTILGGTKELHLHS